MNVFPVLNEKCTQWPNFFLQPLMIYSVLMSPDVCEKRDWHSREARTQPFFLNFKGLNLSFWLLLHLFCFCTNSVTLHVWLESTAMFETKFKENGKGSCCCRWMIDLMLKYSVSYLKKGNLHHCECVLVRRRQIHQPAHAHVRWQVSWWDDDRLNMYYTMELTLSNVYVSLFFLN